MEITSRPQERETHSLPSPRSDNPTTPPPYPTTFVQADTTTFKHVVQMLTGSKPATSSSSQPDPITTKSHPPIRSTGVKKQGSYKQLYERRNNSFKNGLMINPTAGILPRGGGGGGQEILSPSMLNFPSLALSPVTPLIEDPFDRDRSSPSVEEEEKAIAEKGFYLHPSPRQSTPGSEPRLLSLFPVTSPRAAAAAKSSTN